MDRLNDNRHIIHRIMQGHVNETPPEEGMETLAVCDDASGNYMLVELGWQPPQHIHNVIFHLRIKDGLIWVEQDWTEYGVARELLDAGVPADTIELGFQPPEMRPYTELALVRMR